MVKCLPLFAAGVIGGALIGGARFSEIEFASKRMDQLDRLVAQVHANQIRTIEEAIASLPKSTRQNHVLMFDSRSLQKSNYLNPRAIVFDDSAGFIGAFTDAKMRGGDRLEIMQFREASKTYEFREITQLANGLHVSDMNPTKCKRCHTEALIPNWRSYEQWTGAYGERLANFLRKELLDPSKPESQDNVKLVVRTEELNHFRRYQKLAASHPRYKLLHKPQGEPNWPFGKNVGNVKFQGEEPARTSPGRRLGILLNFRTGRMLAEKVVRSDGFRRLPATIQFVMNECGPSSVGFGTPGYDERVMFFNKEVEGRILGGYSEGRRMPHMLGNLNVGVAQAEWNIDFYLRNNPYSKLHAIYQEFFIGVGEMYRTNLVAAAAILAKDSKYSEVFRKGYDFESDMMVIDQNVAKNIFALVPFIKLDAIHNICNELYVRVQAELADRQTAQLLDEARQRFESRSPQILNTCIGCHVVDLETGAPYIPFDSPAKMKAMLHGGNYKRGTFLQELQYRLRMDIPPGHQMPPEESSLAIPESEADRKILQDAVRGYFEEMAKSR